MAKYVVKFSEVDKTDIPLVGGKGANLGEMFNNNFPVPNGFIVTSTAYFDFIDQNGLRKDISNLLSTLNIEDTGQLQQLAEMIQQKILRMPVPSAIELEIKKAYKHLGTNSYVAVRSSATAEDLPTASFAGQQATFLNVKGEEEVFHAVRQAWASLFEARAIYYRQHSKFDHFKVGIAVPVQLMVEAENSGVIFTIDPLTGNKGKIVIEAIYGLGELIVQGQVTPDHYEVAKSDLLILDKQIAVQKKQMVRADGENKIVAVAKKWQSVQKITDNHIIELAKLAKRLEEHYYFPQDIEWAIEKGKVYIVQTRPITTLKNQSQNQKIVLNNVRIDLPIVLKGAPASPGIAFGPVKIINGVKEIAKITNGEILVAEMTNPDFVPAMKKAAAVVTNKGGTTSHAAIVSREMGIPAVVGTGNATKVLRNGQIITVDGARGVIYNGSFLNHTKMRQINFTKREEKENIATPKTATKVYVNLAEPDLAAEIATRDCDGVGLLRAEFMIAQIGIHPKELIAQKKEKVFIENLSDGLAKICREFYPRPVFYRASDFKTNEYANLKGGRKFEPVETNPMLGYRGAYRYVSDPKVFNLELEAIRTVRNKLGLKNINLMIPFVRSVEELRKVKQLISAADLHRGPSFKLWIMVELPVNVILLDQFIEVGIDGVSIGSNDLTMLLLGIDRDNAEVFKSFEKDDAALSWAVEKVIKTAHLHGITSSICGQAASDNTDLVDLAVRLGITSISVNPDAIESTRRIVADVEARLVKESANKYGKN